MHGGHSPFARAHADHEPSRSAARSNVLVLTRGEGSSTRPSRRSLRYVTRATVTVAVYAALATRGRVAPRLGGRALFAFFAALVLVIGYGALVGGQWLRDASAGRFGDRGRRD